jgi:hypothetical protein
MSRHGRVVPIGGNNFSDQTAKTSNEVAIAAVLVRGWGSDNPRNGPVYERLIPKVGRAAKVAK